MPALLLDLCLYLLLALYCIEAVLAHLFLLGRKLLLAFLLGAGGTVLFHLLRLLLAPAFFINLALLFLLLLLDRIKAVLVSLFLAGKLLSSPVFFLFRLQILLSLLRFEAVLMRLFLHGRFQFEAIFFGLAFFFLLGLDFCQTFFFLLLFLLFLLQPRPIGLFLLLQLFFRLCLLNVLDAVRMGLNDSLRRPEDVGIGGRVRLLSALQGLQRARQRVPLPRLLNCGRFQEDLLLHGFDLDFRNAEAAKIVFCVLQRRIDALRLENIEADLDKRVFPGPQGGLHLVDPGFEGNRLFLRHAALDLLELVVEQVDLAPRTLQLVLVEIPVRIGEVLLYFRLLLVRVRLEQLLLFRGLARSRR